MAEKLRRRYTSRIILLSPAETFLLFMTQAPDSSGFSRWITPGGGVEAGESHLEAAIRELHEETGRLIPVNPEPVWRLEFDVSWDQATHNRGIAEYFVARSEEFEPDSTLWTAEEHVDVSAWKWWSVPQLRATTDPYEPLPLPDVVESLLGRR
jgi:8-oxo-dGTP pyrophosphatase MutT (NUDIX family)